MVPSPSLAVPPCPPHTPALRPSVAGCASVHAATSAPHRRSLPPASLIAGYFVNLLHAAGTTTTAPPGYRHPPLAALPISSASPGDRHLLLLAHSPQSTPPNHRRPESPGSSSPTKLISSVLPQYLPRPPPSRRRRNKIGTRHLVPHLAALLSAARTTSPRLDLIHRKPHIISPPPRPQLFHAADSRDVVAFLPLSSLPHRFFAQIKLVLSPYNLQYFVLSYKNV